MTFSVTVRDHIMIAHSLRGEVFGPAQRLHGATFLVDATFRSDDAGCRRHRRRHRPRLARAPRDHRSRCRTAISTTSPTWPGVNTTTERLCQVIGDRLAARSRATGALGLCAADRHRRHAPRVAHRLGVVRGGAVTGDRTVRFVVPGGRRRSRAGQRRQRLRPAGARRPAPTRVGGPDDARWRTRRPSRPRSTSSPGALVLVDGLVAAWAPDALERRPPIARASSCSRTWWPRRSPARSARAADDERRALASAAQVIATSNWTASELVRRGLVAPDRVAVALPGARDGAIGRPGGHRELLCVGCGRAAQGAGPAAGRARRCCSELDWTCTIAGSLDGVPGLRGRVADGAARFDGRVRLTGVLDGAELRRGLPWLRRCWWRRPAWRASGWRSPMRGGAACPVIATAVGGMPGDGRRRRRSPREARRSRGARRRASALDDRSGTARPTPAEALRARAHTPRWADTVAHVDRVLEAA